jgi:hypothetical protein
MISNKSLVPVLDKSIILTITAPNDNAKLISVQCGGGGMGSGSKIANDIVYGRPLSKFTKRNIFPNFVAFSQYMNFSTRMKTSNVEWFLPDLSRSIF